MPVSELDIGSDRVLARGATFLIHAGARRVVTCKVSVPPGLDPARGAAAGEEMAMFLLEQVLQRHSPWLGVVLDLRGGPSVIGPISLRMMERLVERAELVRRRVAILLMPGRMLDEQLSELARARGPHFVTVTDAERTAFDWMTASD